jgi:hypothetical protein
MARANFAVRHASAPNGVDIFAIWQSIRINYHPVARGFLLDFR